MEKKEAVEALTRSAKIEGEWRYNVQRVLEKFLKWTERADGAKLPAGLYAAAVTPSRSGARRRTGWARWRRCSARCGPTSKRLS